MKQHSDERINIMQEEIEDLKYDVEHLNETVKSYEQANAELQ